MSDEIRKEKGDVTPEGGKDQSREQPAREKAQPRDDELYTPQGGGGGTGSGPIRDPEVVEKVPKVGPKEDLREEVLRPGKVTLPQVGEARVEKGQVEEVGSPGEEEGEEVSSFRLLSTLALAGAISGALLVFVFLWSQPIIEAENARVLKAAVTEVLKGPQRSESVFILDGELIPAGAIPPEVDTVDLDRVYLGYDDAGQPLGFAMEAEGFGFQDIIALIFGYDPETEAVLGMKVLRHLETPGLGDKIVKDSAFVGEFDGVAAPIEGVKPDRNTGEADQVDMITGATISSKAVIEIINQRLASLRPLLDSYQPTVGASATAEGGEPDTGADGPAPGATGGAQEEDR